MGRGRVRDVQAEGRGRRRRGAGARRCGRRSGGGADPARRERGVVAGGGDARSSRRSSRWGSSWSSSRWRRSPKRPSSAAHADLAGGRREHRHRRRRARRRSAADSFSVTGVKLSKVGGFERGTARSPGRMRSYVASALDGPVGIAISRRLAEWLDSPRFAEERLAHGLATQRLFARDDRRRASARSRATCCTRPPGPGLGIIDRRGFAATPPTLTALWRLFWSYDNKSLTAAPHGPDQCQYRPRLGLCRGVGARWADAGGRLAGVAVDARSRWRFGGSRGSR